MPYPWTADTTIRIRHPKSSYSWSDRTSQLNSDVPAYPSGHCLLNFIGVELPPGVVTFYIFKHSMWMHAKMQQMQADAHEVSHFTATRWGLRSTKMPFIIVFASHWRLRFRFRLHSRVLRRYVRWVLSGESVRVAKYNSNGQRLHLLLYLQLSPGFRPCSTRIILNILSGLFIDTIIFDALEICTYVFHRTASPSR